MPAACVAVAIDSLGTGIVETDIAWSSSRPEIVTVDSDGTVTPVRYGTVVITASVGDETADAIIRVVRHTTRYEANVFALYESEELRPPTDVADRFLRDLASIRDAYGEDIPVVDDIRTYAPWVPSSVVIVFTGDWASQVLDGHYHEWDSLNILFGVIPFDSAYLRVLPRELVLTFDQLLHPKRLAEAYGALAGIRQVTVNGRHTNWAVFSERRGDRWTYLFWRTQLYYWSYHVDDYWYFSTQGDVLTYHGSWNVQVGSDGVAPDWWAEACPMREFGSYQIACE